MYANREICRVEKSIGNGRFLLIIPVKKSALPMLMATRFAFLLLRRRKRQRSLRHVKVIS
jgi:hypothetical protein